MPRITIIPNHPLPLRHPAFRAQRSEKMLGGHAHLDPLAFLLQVADAVPQHSALVLGGEQAAAQLISGGGCVLEEALTLHQSGLKTSALLERVEEVALAATEGACEDLGFAMAGMMRTVRVIVVELLFIC